MLQLIRDKEQPSILMNLAKTSTARFRSRRYKIQEVIKPEPNNFNSNILKTKEVKKVRLSLLLFHMAGKYSVS